MHFRNAYPLNSQLEAWIDLKVSVSSSWEKEKGGGRRGRRERRQEKRGKRAGGKDSFV